MVFAEAATVIKAGIKTLYRPDGKFAGLQIIGNDEDARERLGEVLLNWENPNEGVFASKDGGELVFIGLKDNILVRMTKACERGISLFLGDGEISSGTGWKVFDESNGAKNSGLMIVSPECIASWVGGLTTTQPSLKSRR